MCERFSVHIIKLYSQVTRAYGYELLHFELKRELVKSLCLRISIYQVSERNVVTRNRRGQFSNKS